MKGIATTLVIIVTAIVILVAALVVLTIFGGGMQPIVDISQARNLCMQQAALTCPSTGNFPPGWYSKNMKYTGPGGTVVTESCDVITGCKCEENVMTGRYELRYCVSGELAG